MNYRLLTNIIGTIALIVFLGYCFMIFKTTGWAGLLGAFTAFITIIIYNYSNRRNKK